MEMPMRIVPIHRRSRSLPRLSRNTFGTCIMRRRSRVKVLQKQRPLWRAWPCYPEHRNEAKDWRLNCDWSNYTDISTSGRQFNMLTKSEQWIRADCVNSANNHLMEFDNWSKAMWVQQLARFLKSGWVWKGWLGKVAIWRFQDQEKKFECNKRWRTWVAARTATKEIKRKVARTVQKLKWKENLFKFNNIWNFQSVIKWWRKMGRRKSCSPDTSGNGNSTTNLSYRYLWVTKLSKLKGRGPQIETNFHWFNI